VLDEHGFVVPVVARRTDRQIVDGHQRVRANALRRRPDELIPVVFLAGISDTQAKAMNVALNNVAGQGEYDLRKLGKLLAGLSGEDLELPAATGFTEDQIADLTRWLDRAPAPPGAVDLPECFQVVVECESEARQRRVYERMSTEGHNCRVLTV